VRRHAAPRPAASFRRLAAAFAGGGWERVRSFRLGDPPDDTGWFAGEGWWLSTEEE